MPTLPTFDRTAIKTVDHLPTKPAGRTAAESELAPYIDSARHEGPKEFPALSADDSNGTSDVELVARELRRAARLAGLKIRIRMTKPDENNMRVMTFAVTEEADAPEEETTEVSENGDGETAPASRRTRGRRS